jgi:hypothetical protein
MKAVTPVVVAFSVQGHRFKCMALVPCPTNASPPGLALERLLTGWGDNHEHGIDMHARLWLPSEAQVTGGEPSPPPAMVGRRFQHMTAATNVFVLVRDGGDLDAADMEFLERIKLLYPTPGMWVESL